MLNALAPYSIAIVAGVILAFVILAVRLTWRDNARDRAEAALPKEDEPQFRTYRQKP